jgi:hypothetical protein
MENESYKSLPGDTNNVETESGDVIVDPGLAEFDPTLLVGEHHPETIVDEPLPEDAPEVDAMSLEKKARYKQQYELRYTELDNQGRLDASQIRAQIVSEIGEEPQ